MKISINSQFLNEPYGGGMQFANYLRQFLTAQGVIVINNLCDQDIDIILHINPFPFLTRRASAYSFLEAYAYKLRHPGVVIVQRINECDERKGTHYMNKLLVAVSRRSDYIVFVGTWLKPLLINSGLSADKPSCVILNGADSCLFNTAGKILWNEEGKLKIVTHHWSKNLRKGHDSYQRLDALLDDKPYHDLFEFSYIGVCPPGLAYKNTKFIAPLFGEALAHELKKHHAYITASQNDPGPNHPPEAAQCGLPILYINSGALPEYCAGFGIEFTLESLGDALLKIRRDYNKYTKALKSFPLSAERTATHYYELFQELSGAPKVARRGAVLSVRIFYLYAKVMDFLLKIKFRVLLKFL